MSASLSELGLQDVADFNAVASGIWRADHTRRISDVVAANYCLSPETESDPGPVDLEIARFWREPLDFCNDPRVRKITVMGSTQVAKTVFCQGAILALAEVDPAPSMFVAPTNDEIRVQRDRIYGNALASEDPFAARVPPKRLWNLQKLDFAGQLVYLAFSGSAQRLRGKPCKRVFMSEIDVYDFSNAAGDPIKAAGERVKQFTDSLIFQESSPTGEDSVIFNEYQKSDQRKLHVQCPKCGRWQEFRFFPYAHGELAGRGGVVGYRDQAGNLIEPDEARKRVHYVCESGCEIDQSYKNAMISGGRWVPIGSSVLDADGDWPIVGKKGVRHVGFHIWTAFNPKISLGDIAATFIEFVNDGALREFFENWLGLRFKSGKRIATWEDVARRYKSDYSICEVPAAVWFLTCGIDVQGDRIVFLIVGWGPGRTPYLIQWGQLYQTVGKVEADADESDQLEPGVLISSDLSQIPGIVLDRSFPVAGGVNPLGLDRLVVRVAGVDSNFRTHDVHDWVKSVDQYGDRVRAVRGDHTVDPREKYRRNIVDRNTRTGEIYKGGLEQWGIFVDGYESKVSDRLGAQAGTVGAIRLPVNVLPDGQDMLKQLVNKQRVVERDPRGKTRTVYKVVSSKIGVDYRDCLIYAEAMADMVVADIGWSESDWIEWRDRQNSSATIQAELNESDFNDFGDDYLAR